MSKVVAVPKSMIKRFLSGCILFAANISAILSAPSPLSIPSRIFISSLILSSEIKTGSVLKNFFPRYSKTSLMCGTTDETTISVTLGFCFTVNKNRQSR